MHHFIFCTVIPAADLCILQHMSNFLTLSKSALLKVVNPPFTGSVSEHPAIGEVFESISSSFSDNFVEEVFFEDKCHEKIMLGAFSYRGANIDIGFDVCSCSDSDYAGAGSYSDAADEW